MNLVLEMERVIVSLRRATKELTVIQEAIEQGKSEVFLPTVHTQSRVTPFTKEILKQMGLELEQGEIQSCVRIKKITET